MKNCDEMVNSLFERKEQYEVAKKRRINRFTRTVSFGCCVCIIVLLGFSVWKAGLFEKTPPVTMDDSVNIGEKDYIEPNKDSTNSSNVFGDVKGVVVVGGVTYTQFAPANELAYTPHTYLGYAHDFEGTYKEYVTGVLGELYTVKESADVLLIQLDNGGTVYLVRE